MDPPSVSFERFKAQRRAAVRYAAETTGAGEEGAGLYVPPDGRQLVGRPTSSFPVAPSGGEQAELNAPGLYASVDLRSTVVPSHIAGSLIGSARTGQQLAIAVNGTVRAVTRTYKWGSPRTIFSAVVPPSAFRQGANRVEVFGLVRGERRYALARLSRDAGVRLATRDGREVLILPPGRELPVQQGAVRGYIERLTASGNAVIVTGWAADARRRRPARRVLMFVGNRLVASTVPFLSRPDVANVVGKGAERSGFVLAGVSDEALALAKSSRLRILAVGDSQVSQLELSDVQARLEGRGG